MKVIKGKTEERLVTFSDFNGKESSVSVYPWSNGEGYVVAFEGGVAFELTYCQWDALKSAIDFVGEIKEMEIKNG